MNRLATTARSAAAGVIVLAIRLASGSPTAADLQVLAAPFGGEPGADPRAVLAFVWHGAAGTRTANNRRSTR